MSKISSGFMVTCFMAKENAAYKEAVSLLDSVIVENIDINTDENKTIEIVNEKRKKYFDRLIIKKFKNIIFIRNLSNYLPTKIFEEIKKKELCAKFVQRVVPLDYFCELIYSDLIIKKIIKDVHEIKPKSYKVVLSGRLCEKITKEEILDGIVSLLDYKVDLKTPEIYIIVEILKNFVGMSIVREDFNKFNINRDNFI